MKLFLAGIFIGIGAILPGISSGVFLVIFGLYEKIIDSFIHFFKDIKKNFLFLFPICFGIFISALLFSNILLVCFNSFHVYTYYAFIGLIIGSISSIYKHSEINRPNFFHVLFFIFSFTFSIYLILIEKANTQSLSNYSYSYLILVGIFMSAGVVIPGVSKTAILIMMGVYTTYLAAISTLDFSILIPIGIGLIIGGLVFMYLINLLFSYFKSYTYCLILGFVIASCFVIFPGFSFKLEHIIGITISMFCFFLVKKIESTYT